MCHRCFLSGLEKAERRQIGGVFQKNFILIINPPSNGKQTSAEPLRVCLPLISDNGYNLVGRERIYSIDGKWRDAVTTKGGAVERESYRMTCKGVMIPAGPGSPCHTVHARASAHGRSTDGYRTSNNSRATINVALKINTVITMGNYYVSS